MAAKRYWRIDGETPWETMRERTELHGLSVMYLHVPLSPRGVLQLEPYLLDPPKLKLKRVLTLLTSGGDLPNFFKMSVREVFFPLLLLLLENDTEDDELDEDEEEEEEDGPPKLICLFSRSCRP